MVFRAPPQWIRQIRHIVSYTNVEDQGRWIGHRGALRKVGGGGEGSKKVVGLKPYKKILNTTL